MFRAALAEVTVFQTCWTRLGVNPDETGLHLCLDVLAAFVSCIQSARNPDDGPRLVVLARRGCHF